MSGINQTLVSPSCVPKQGTELSPPVGHGRQTGCTVMATGAGIVSERHNHRRAAIVSAAPRSPQPDNGGRHARTRGARGYLPTDLRSTVGGELRYVRVACGINSGPGSTEGRQGPAEYQRRPALAETTARRRWVHGGATPTDSQRDRACRSGRHSEVAAATAPAARPQGQRSRPAYLLKWVDHKKQKEARFGSSGKVK